MKLPPRLETIVDAGGLAIALVVDIIINVVCFSILSPDLLTSIAFVAIGAMIVLFVFRSWSRGQHFAWAIFVIVVFFFDLSFTLEATKTQSSSMADPELIRLTSQSDLASQQVIDLQGQYDRATQRATMDQLDAQIKVAQSKIDQYEADRKARLAEVAGGHIERAHMTADAIFDAIPQSVIDHRFIQLFIFSMIFAGLQLIIATSIDNGPVVSIPVSNPIGAKPIEIEPTDEEIKTFVKYSWYKIRSKTDTSILAEEVFLRLMEKQGKNYNIGIYQKLRKKSVESGIIDVEGVSEKSDEGEIIELLRK